MLAIPNSFYAQWRLEGGVLALLRDQPESPPERLLQAIWQHQRLLRDQLVCLDGRPVRILHPGYHNREGGPDFRNAIVQFGSELPCSGDIEIDLRAGGWIAHGHHDNPAFAQVVLHVLWDGSHAAPGTPATLVLQGNLDSPLPDLCVSLNSGPDLAMPDCLRGRCCAAFMELSAAQTSRLLRQAAEIRFHSKTAQLQARARQVGWEQALWEGLFRALGFKHNTWPMHCLAEKRARWCRAGASAMELQARLLGIAGLLPSDLTRTRKSADTYLRRIWDLWWREREQFEDCLLPYSLWRFHGQRPANHPQRRLALAAHWLALGDRVGRIESWCAEDMADSQLRASLLRILNVPDDPFWSWHWTVQSARMKRRQPLLGPGRVTDLAVNVILPWLWTRAVEGGNAAVQDRIEHRYLVWSAGQDNSALRFARQRLLGAKPGTLFRSAAEQQGCLQISHDFCDRSDSLCGNCRFPELVRRWIKNGNDPYFVSN